MSSYQNQMNQAYNYAQDSQGTDIRYLKECFKSNATRTELLRADMDALLEHLSLIAVDVPATPAKRRLIQAAPRPGSVVFK